MSSLVHLACIMDGNRRWAKKHGMFAYKGYSEGLEAIKKVIGFCIKKKIKFLSLYAFSSENFRRSDEEKGFLFDLAVKKGGKGFLSDLIKNGVAVKFVGDLQLFPKDVRETCIEMEQETSHCKTLIINMLFGYGARQEIVSASKKMARDLASKKISEEDISEESFKKYLWTNGTPDPEVIVRTGLVKRLSNFLLYQAAYSELYFPNCLWPEIEEEHLQQIWDDYHGVKKNFGH